MKKLFVPIITAILMLAVAIGAVQAAAPGPAPAAAPRVVVINSAAIAADTTFRSIPEAGYSDIDVFYRIDVDDEAVNTTTLELEVSPDGLNWYDHAVVPDIVSDVATDTNGYTASIAVHGYYFRILANVSTTDTVTPNIKAVMR